MYAVVNRRRMNEARAEEARERATREFHPKLQEAPGFISFSLVQGEQGVNVVVILFESKDHADAAFAEIGESWSRTLDALGHQLESRDTGEVVQHLTPGT